MRGIGVDFGTSNSVIAVYDGASVECVAIEHGAAVMPSALYLHRGLKARDSRIGQAAIDAYIESNRGRRVELVPEVVGRAELLLGGGSETTRAAPETVSGDIHGALVDAGQPGRLFRGVKRLLADPDYERMTVFDHAYRIVALMTPVLLHMRQCVSAFPVAAHVGRPVRFEGADAAGDALAEGRLREACRHAGLDVRGFMPEPIAAALAYLERYPLQNGHLLTFDFGGGTLDLAVVRCRRGEPEVLLTRGAAVGGDHIDRRMFEVLLFPLLGKGERWRRQVDGRLVDTPFPFERYEHLLLNWPTSHLLNQGEYKGPVHELARSGGAVGRKFQRLYDLIVQNLGYEVFSALSAAKERLSSATDTTLDVPEIDVSLELTRERLESIFAEPLAIVAETLDSTLADAGLEARAYDAVICTGGSSLIPAVQRLFDRRLPGRRVAFDPFTSVAAGLAIADYQAQAGQVSVPR